MKEFLTIATIAGSLQIIYLKDFIYQVPLALVHDDIRDITYPVINYSTAGIQIEGPLSIPTSNIQSKSEYLKSHTTGIGYPELVSAVKEHLFEGELAVRKQIQEQIEIMVAKKKPDLFLKDLNLESINELSSEYVRRSGRSTPSAVHVQLSPYQKFLILIDPNDLKFYCTKPICYAMENEAAYEIKFNGAFINLRPDHFVMARYDEDITLSEMANQRFYVPVGTDVKFKRLQGGLMTTDTRLGYDTIINIKNFGDY